MGNYIEWDDVVGRYAQAQKVAGAQEMSDSFIDGVEAFVDGMIGRAYTVPVPNAPALLKDICIDLVYAKMTVHKDKSSATIRENALGILENVINGQIALIDSSGDTVGLTGGAVWSSHQDYHSSFSELGALYDRVDPDLLEDLADDRNQD